MRARLGIRTSLVAGFWSTFRRLMGCQEFLTSSDSERFKAWALIEFAS